MDAMRICFSSSQLEDHRDLAEGIDKNPGQRQGSHRSFGAVAVVHLGALVGDPACELDQDLALEVNLGATRTVAAVARGLDIERFVFASTCSVYGASEDLLDEDSPLGPISLYARTKMDSE